MRSSNSRRRSQRSFPEWTPPCIRDLAQILYNDAKRHKVRAKDEKSFYRVTLDPRMKRVWDELLKKKRGLRGIEWANLGSEGVRKLCIS